MGNETQPRAADIEVVRKIYAGINGNDILGIAQYFDPEVEMVIPAEFPQGGTNAGRDAVLAHLVKARQTWAEGTCEPERFIVAGPDILVFDYVKVRLKTETEFREGP